MSDWINIGESLPEPGQHVIAYCENYPNYFVSMVRFEKGKEGYYFWNDSINEEGKVTHWMPLPDPP